MENPVAFLLKEWHVIWKAKVTFGIVLALVVGGVWWIAGQRYSAQIDGLNAQISDLNTRISLRSDQINDLKAKVGTASADAIKAQLDSLKAQIRALRPRRLSLEKRNALTAALENDPGFIEIAEDMGSPDARGYAGDIILAFQNAGWTVSTPAVLGPSNPPPTGLQITVPNPHTLTTKQAEIVNAFRKLGIQFNLTKGSPMNIPGQHALSASILVSQKIL